MMCPRCVYTISEDVVAIDFSFKIALWLHSTCNSQVCTYTRRLDSSVNSSGTDCMESQSDCKLISESQLRGVLGFLRYNSFCCFLPEKKGRDRCGWWYSSGRSEA